MTGDVFTSSSVLKGSERGRDQSGCWGASCQTWVVVEPFQGHRCTGGQIDTREILHKCNENVLPWRWSNRNRGLGRGGISPLGDMQNLSGHSLEQPGVFGPALRRGWTNISLSTWIILWSGEITFSVGRMLLGSPWLVVSAVNWSHCMRQQCQNIRVVMKAVFSSLAVYKQQGTNYMSISVASRTSRTNIITVRNHFPYPVLFYAL